MDVWLLQIEVPSIKAEIGNDTISLNVGGVRAYKQENLHNKESPERFKLFIGFKNWACTNLCVSTDGFLVDLKVSSTQALLESALQFFESFRIDSEVQQLQKM